MEELLVRTSGASTVVLGGTGWSQVAEVLTTDRPDLVVLDPLSVAFAACVRPLDGRLDRSSDVVRHRHVRRQFQQLNSSTVRLGAMRRCQTR